MRAIALIILVVLGAFNTLKAQDRDLVQFSGVIYNVDTNAVVPYVSITNTSDNNQNYSANYQGFFSFVAHKGDTIVFSAVGYRKEALVIPSDLSANKYTVIMKMHQEAINLPAVRVYPWASVDEFNRAFMTMKVADDDLEIAKKNVNRESLIALSKTLPRDGQEIQNWNFQNNHIALSNQAINQKGANPLLDPFKWGAFIQQIMKGDKSRSAND